MNDSINPRVVLVAITKHGAKQVANLAPKLAEANVVVSEKFAPTMQDLNNTVKPYSGPLRAQLPTLFTDYDQIIFCVSLGAVVRLIAPCLKSKEEDPGVLVIDDAAQFVIPVLSGHVGGANAFAEQIANILGAIAVLTTASDVGKTIAVDILGRELGWQVEAPKINITRVSAHVVNEEPIAFVQEAGSTKWWTRATPLPSNIHVFNSYQEVDPKIHKAVLMVTNRDIDISLWQQWGEYMVIYRPPVEESSQSPNKES